MVNTEKGEKESGNRLSAILPFAVKESAYLCESKLYVIFFSKVPLPLVTIRIMSVLLFPFTFTQHSRRLANLGEYNVMTIPAHL